MTDQTPRISRRWLYAPFAIAAIILAGYYLLWRTGAHEMKKAVDAWVIDQRAAGLEVSHGPVTSKGFPFFLRVRIEAPDIAMPGAWRWRAETLFLDALPYDLNRLIISPGGEQLLSAEGFGEWRGAAADLRASIANDKARGWVFALTVGDAAGRRDSDGAAYRLTSLVLDLAPAPDDPATLTLNLAANGLEISAGGETYDMAQLQTVLSLSASDMLETPTPAASWREANGALTITHFFADIETTKIALSGAIQLDQALYPQGALKTELQSPAGLANLLGKTGALSQTEASAMAAGLTLMAITSGGKITAPIELKDGAAQIAGVKIADLPRLK
ncbi:MAG: DUF2125 domain-containing protein [Alphaproteobacteria bacterium]|nr:DUF2125 domain-containing protein [Alphaproteobacteria bacterium]